MRALIAERFVLDPASATVPRTYCQFGPLHTTLMRPFIALDHDAPRSSRYLSLLCGLPVFFPFFALARRLVGEARAELAILAAGRLAASPAGVDDRVERGALSPALGRGDRAAAGGARSRKAGTFAVGGLLASLAAVTRYDAWLALPMVAIAASGLRARPSGLRAARPRAFALAAAIFPLGWLAWGAAAGGDPLFFAHYISSDHAGLAATAAARYGALGGRARQLGVWSLAFVAAMTPPGACWRAGRSPAVRARCHRPCAWWSSPRWGHRRSTSPRASSRRASSRWRASRSSRARCSCHSPPRPFRSNARAPFAGGTLASAARIFPGHVAGRHRGPRADLGGRRIDGGADPARRRGPRAGRPPARRSPAGRAGA